MDIKSLIELNRKAAFDRFGAVRCIHEDATTVLSCVDKKKIPECLIVAQDLIDACSSKPDTDKRYISNFGDEICTRHVVGEKGLKKMRCLTFAGVQRMLLQCHVYCHDEFCEYFSVACSGEEKKQQRYAMQLEKFLTADGYKVNSVCRWLCGKRTSFKKIHGTIAEIIALAQKIGDVDDSKLKFLRGMA